MSEIVRQDELHAAIEARKELGAELEPALVDSFVERIEQRLSERTEESRLGQIALPWAGQREERMR